MASRGHSFLAVRLAAGPLRIGQVEVRPGFAIHHRDDAERPDLRVFTDPHDALEIARFDDEGHYRPLKTAPNLPHGWRLELATIEAVSLALDFLYPAAVALAVAHDAGNLAITPLRQTPSRQSGRYAIVAKLADAQANAVISRTCRSTPGCLRRVLWPLDAGKTCVLTESHPSAAPDEIPLWCPEACNFLVEAGRKALKEGSGSENTSPSSSGYLSP